MLRRRVESRSDGSRSERREDRERVSAFGEHKAQTTSLGVTRRFHAEDLAYPLANSGTASVAAASLDSWQGMRLENEGRDVRWHEGDV